jgi:predicted nucleic acid-binding protein
LFSHSATKVHQNKVCVHCCFVLAEAAFRRDWLTIARVACDQDLNRRIDDLHLRHALRGADSTHLAAAIKYRDLCGEPLTFVCADVQLRQAALTEGFTLVP